jgi:hypothetical protein
MKRPTSPARRKHIRCAPIAVLIAAIATACPAQPAAKEPTMRASLTDSLEHLYSDSDATKTGAAKMALDVARGGTVAANVLLSDVPAGAELNLSVKAAGRAARAARWFRLLDVPVETNTGLVGFVERKGQPKNPHVIRRAPFRVYDAMEPVASPVKAAAATTALRLEIPVARDARPGPRAYTVTIAAGRQEQRLDLTVTVHKALIPPVGKRSLPYTNWFSLAIMAKRHGLKPFSEAHWEMIGRYARLMARGRQNAFWVPWGDIFQRTKAGLVLDRPKMRRLVETFTEAGMYYIEGGHVGHRTGGKWTSPTFDITMGGPRATSPEGVADLARACKQLMEEIERNGWRDRWVQHITDEPIDVNAEDYRKLAAMVRKHMAGLPILDATESEKLVGLVDIWCPKVQEYQRRRDFFDARRAAGDRVWVYTCCFPGGPWLNRLLDMELLRPALLGWATARYDLDGFLHWGLNHYRSDQDPFNQSVVAHGGNNRLPAGDTHVVYPGKDAPWSSLRFEAQREGLEDYELLKQLKAKDPKTAARIVAKAFRAYDDYTKDTRTFRQARKALLEALDQ